MALQICRCSCLCASGVLLVALHVALAALSPRCPGAAFDLHAALAAAQPGDTITVPAGVYPATVIDKPVTLEGRTCQ